MAAVGIMIAANVRFCLKAWTYAGALVTLTYE